MKGVNELKCTKNQRVTKKIFSSNSKLPSCFQRERLEIKDNCTFFLVESTVSFHVTYLIYLKNLLNEPKQNC